MEDRRKGGRRETDRLSAKEAAERAGEALDRIAIIAMEQGNIEKMQQYIRHVDAVRSMITTLADDIQSALNNRDYDIVKEKNEKIIFTIKELKGIESKIFENDD